MSDTAVCTCDREDLGRNVRRTECPLHVECDDSDCRVLRSPTTVEEYEATLEHWELHSWLAGCSHGC